MPKINYIFLSGVLCALVSLFFSAHGLITLFAGAGFGIIALAIVLELAKVTSVVYLIANFRARALPLAMALVVTVLVLVSTVGIYGYLGQAYSRTRADVAATTGDIAVVEADIEALTEERADRLAVLETIAADQGTNRRRMLQDIQPQLDELDRRIAEKRDSLSVLRRQEVRKEHDVGQLKYAAELLGLSGDTLARLVIATLALVLDPIAVLLILASGIHHRHAAEWGVRDEELEAEEEEIEASLQPEEPTESGEGSSLMEDRVFDKPEVQKRYANYR